MTTQFNLCPAAPPSLSERRLSVRILHTFLLCQAFLPACAISRAITEPSEQRVIAGKGINYERLNKEEKK